MSATKSFRLLPIDAFSYYMSLGIDRSYNKVADKYGVGMTTVYQHAKAEKWQQRIKRADEEVRLETERKYKADSLKQRDKHLAALNLVINKAIKRLGELEFETASEASKAMVDGIKTMRLITGESTENIDVARVIRDNHSRWLSERAHEDMQVIDVESVDPQLQIENADSDNAEEGSNEPAQ